MSGAQLKALGPYQGLCCLPHPWHLQFAVHSVTSVCLVSSPGSGRDPGCHPRIISCHFVNDRGYLPHGTLCISHLPVTWEGWEGAGHPLTEEKLGLPEAR